VEVLILYSIISVVAWYGSGGSGLLQAEKFKQPSTTSHGFKIPPNSRSQKYTFWKSFFI